MKRKRDSTDTTITDVSSAWDANSGVASSCSPISVPDQDSPKLDECAPQNLPEARVIERQPQIAFNWNLYATAASQRPRRSRESQPQYADTISEESLSSVEATKPQDTIEVRPVQPSRTADEEECPQTDQRRQALKRKAQISVTDVTSQPPPKKARKAPTKRAKQDVTSTQRKQPAAPVSRQPRKRKAELETSDEVQPTPPKKAKTLPVKPPKQNESDQLPAFAEDEARPLRRITRGLTRSRKAVSPSTIVQEEPPAGQSEHASLIVVLKMSQLARIGCESPAQSQTPLQPQIAMTESDDVAASGVQSADTSDMVCLYPRSFFMSHANLQKQNSSFRTTMSQSYRDVQEQCAQPALAPVPASSQGASSFSSQATHLLRPYDIPSLPTVQEESEDHELNISPAKYNKAPWLQSLNADALAPELPAAAKAVDRHENIGVSPSVSFASTQPTLVLSQPWEPSKLVARELEQDADSDATTEDEMEFDVPVNSTELSDVQTDHLHKIAGELFASRKPGMTKPAPTGQPEVWADGRQELCETLHYFRSYQSACYSTGDFVRGFMFDKVAHPRDYMDSDVVISRAGGGLIKDKDSGEMRTGKDQVEDTKIVQALKNCMKHFNPVVIITGVDNPHIPSQPPHQYCVLDYFKPTDVWVEKSGNSKILRYRFEKLNTKKESWWRPTTEHASIELGSLDPPVEKTCKCCGVSSFQIYLNGWMCLQPSCTAFWHIINHGSATHRRSYEPDEASLIYDPRFLKRKSPWPNDDHELPLSSNSPELSGYSIAGEDTSQAFWSGIVCPACGRCNSRLNWMGWDCLNPQCTFKKLPPHTLIPAKNIQEPFWPLTDSYTLSRDTHTPLIDVSVSFSHGYRINRYALPGISGFITHMIANRNVISEPGGPDSMFEELQQTDIDLRRRAMPNGQLKGESYCRHFTVNYGMPYKFIAATASHPFNGVARPITATRSRLNWAAKHLLTQETGKTMDEVSELWDEQEFNEVLALGYFEAQKINYHDDGEFGLGPTIATLSLGAPGTMRIRMKARHYNGSSPAGVYDDAPPLPGCQQYDERLALQSGLEDLKQTDPKAYRARLKHIPKQLKLKSSGNAKDVLRMELGHGDIVVMHGAEMQKYYEHAVEHAGKLRFALTCRYIDPDSLKEEDRPGYVVGRDEGGYDGSKVG